MYIVDSHCDSIQQVDNGRHPLVNPYNFSKEHLQLQMVAIFCSWPGESQEDCYRRAVRYIGHFCIAMQSEKQIMQVKTYTDIEESFRLDRHAALLTVEGGTGIKGSKKIFNDFYNIGVRIFGFAWLSNDLAKCNRVIKDGEEDTGLSKIGREIVEEGNRLGMIFDVSHLSDKSFWDVAEVSAKPLVATHSNFRTLCGHSRNLTDDMARQIIAGDGMIGLNLCTSFIHDEPEKQTVEYYFKHLDYCLEKFGEDHIGFGGDIDGLSGKYPAPLKTDRSIHDQLLEFMGLHNYSDALIEKVAGGNYLNFLKKYL
jgi:membrane dipeptidase